MHHVVLEQWSRRESALHRRDPRAKIAALVLFLVIVATTRHAFAAAGACYLALLVGVLLWARLPLWNALSRAAVVLPFTLVADPPQCHARRQIVHPARVLPVRNKYNRPALRAEQRPRLRDREVDVEEDCGEVQTPVGHW